MQKLVNYKKIGKGIGKKNRKEFLSTALEYPENLNISENFKETVCLKYCFGCGYLVSFNNCVTPEGLGGYGHFCNELLRKLRRGDIALLLYNR